MVEEFSDNPLLALGELPDFAAVRPEHVAPAVDSILATLNAELDALESSAEVSWEAVVEPLERIGDRLGFAWGVVGHLMGVRNSEAMREAFEASQPEVVAFGLRQGQSRPIYDRLTALG